MEILNYTINYFVIYIIYQKSVQRVSDYDKIKKILFISFIK